MSNRSVDEMSQWRCSLISVNNHGLMSAPLEWIDTRIFKYPNHSRCHPVLIKGPVNTEAWNCRSKVWGRGENTTKFSRKHVKYVDSGIFFCQFSIHLGVKLGEYSWPKPAEYLYISVDNGSPTLNELGMKSCQCYTCALWTSNNDLQKLSPVVKLLIWNLWYICQNTHCDSITVEFQKYSSIPTRVNLFENLL